ncbi:MAG TPA: SBBP repeat-containing protein [Thermoanaerobaculia bacterium]|nr:SBBP repeat-containing protein [Thermoanaerobaculia bacterium]
MFSLGDAKPAAQTVRLHLAGGAKHPALVGIDPLPTKTNYLLGKDPRAWHTGVASFAGVRYEKVYPGTDLVFSGNDRRVEQSFFLAAGAEPRRIRLIYEGATAAEVGKAGELIVRTPGGELTADRPVAYQVIRGERRAVECRYELLAKGTAAPAVGFALGAYDRGLPLVIDPVFNNSTFLGGAESDGGSAIAVDGAGNVYVAGNTSSTDFPGTVTPGGVQPANGGSVDGFVAKIDPTGTTLLYSTYLGGDDLDSVTGIAVDPSGNAYLTGFTDSSNFPVTAGTLQSAYAGGPGDVFVAKLSPAGSSLLYSTYLGGTGNDTGYKIAIDASGNAYVTGYTVSTDFPGVVAGSLQPSNAGGFSDAFVTKVNATGSTIVYSTYLGGSDQDIGAAIALDTAGDAVVAGTTCSTNFPVTAGSLAPVSPGLDCGAGLQDSFVAKLNPLGTALVYSTFLGGEANDAVQGLAVDTAGSAYVTGFTSSTSFTGVTAGSFQPANPGGNAAFVTKINAAGNAAVYSTFLGGQGTLGYAIALDAAANAYVTGVTDDPDFPVVNAATLQPASAGRSDGFVTKIAASGASLGFSTYFGGTDYDAGHAIAVDGTNNSVYVTGQSFSTELPGVTPGSIQPANGGPGVDDAFLVRIVPAAILSISKTADTSLVDPSGKITYTLAYQNVGELSAAGASLTETVPDNTVFKPASSTPGWSCTPSDDAGSTCTLALGTVAVGASGSATFTVKVKANVSAAGSQISNTACAHPGPNCATVETPTTAAPILSITKTAQFTEAKPGNVLRYKIKYSNTGNQDADPVIVTDTVPGNAVFDPTDSTAGWSCTPDNSAGSVCTFPAGTLAAGANGSVIFAVTLSTLYSNTACVQVASPQPEFRSPRALHKALPSPACSTATTPLK